MTRHEYKICFAKFLMEDFQVLFLHWGDGSVYIIKICLVFKEDVCRKDSAAERSAFFCVTCELNDNISTEKLETFFCS